MRIRSATRGEPFYRQQDDDLWEPWQYRCDICGMTTPSGEHICAQCKLEEKEPPPLPYPWCSRPEYCRRIGYCDKDPNCGE